MARSDSTSTIPQIDSVTLEAEPRSGFTSPTPQTLSEKEEKGQKFEERSESVHDNPLSPEDDFPDGGTRAWLIVVGAMCNTFATFGYANSWGVFQSYYQETILSDSSPSNIAWIGSIQYALIFFPGLITGRLFDLGYYHSILITSTAILVASTFLVAQCTQYWHFLLCQGFAVGLSCGCIFSPTAAIVSHWFKKRRGLAMGFVAVGSSIGGTVLPIATRKLILLVGFQWTMRITGFILLGVLGVANLLLKRRLPPRNVVGGLINLSAFKSASYTVYCLSGLVIFLGLYTLLTYVAVSAVDIGIPDDVAFYFIAFGNASSLFGRYFGGLVSDWLGPMNVMIPMTIGAGVLTYAWPFARSEASLIVVTLIYGFFAGAYVSLVCNPIMDMGDTSDVGRRVGMFLSIMALGAVAGPPISGAIAAATGSFVAVGVYAGSCVVVGVGLMAVSRSLVLKSLYGKL
ncbi:MFS general substrate transporter [Crepidotus variabilis]|uniref:MFS general substrate transporter n=1 Tax=Crepidotus variabilis TaxID=179855 RepID=A0A9P6E8L7_9AGAR|nr:MFS general substrate transporter [Crepidotus variabilis]